jgi:hypothetical protein
MLHHRTAHFHQQTFWTQNLFSVVIYDGTYLCRVGRHFTLNAILAHEAWPVHLSYDANKCANYLHTLIVKNCTAPNPTKICHSLVYCISHRWQNRMQQWLYCKRSQKTTVSDDGNLKSSKEHLFQHGYVHHKPHTASSGIEPRLPWWEASE